MKDEQIDRLLNLLSKFTYGGKESPSGFESLTMALGGEGAPGSRNVSESLDGIAAALDEVAHAIRYHADETKVVPLNQPEQKEDSSQSVIEGEFLSVTRVDRVEPSSPWQRLVEAQRIKHDLSVRQIAILVRIPAGTLFSWIRAKSGVPPQEAYIADINQRFAEAIQVDASELQAAYEQSIGIPL